MRRRPRGHQKKATHAAKASVIELREGASVCRALRHRRAGNNLISSWRGAASCVAFLCPLSGYANKETRGHRGSSPSRDHFSAAVDLPRSAFLYSYCKLTRYRINKVSSSTGSTRNQMKCVWLFARYGIIGLRLDDVPGVRAKEHEWPHTQTFCLWSFVVPRADIVQVAVRLSSAPDLPELHEAR
jgi:hypothetical protein